MMKKIVLICYGRLKTCGFEEAVYEFSKRLSRYTDFKTVELKPLKISEKSESLRESICEKEGQEVINLISSVSFKSNYARNPEIWCLDETGKTMKTTEWADAFNDLNLRGSGELVLIIGGSLGLSVSLKKMCQKKIGFGPQTFSHELARLVLVEQLYRALSYNSGHPYHNEG